MRTEHAAIEHEIDTSHTQTPHTWGSIFDRRVDPKRSRLWSMKWSASKQAAPRTTAARMRGSLKGPLEVANALPVVAVVEAVAGRST